MKTMPLTLEDIAREAGVSRSTVSRVVNGQPNVRESVRNRVMAVIQATGFHPNAAARMLASQRSWMIGLVLPRSVSSFFGDPYFPRLTQGIAQACNHYNYTLGLFLISSKEDEEKIFPRVSRRSLLDGVLLQSGDVGEQLTDRLVSSNMPVLVVGRPPHPRDLSYIDVDNVSASYNAVTHLLKLGYQRIATITGLENHTESIDRLDGYIKALQEYGRQVDRNLIAVGDFTESGGYQAMQELIPQRPDAVFAASDVMALGGMRAVREIGLKIPEDIAFVGFDDLPLATVPDVGLTTVRQPISQFGYKAVEILIDMIEHGTEPPRQVIMGTELIIRNTCGSRLKGLF